MFVFWASKRAPPSGPGRVTDTLFRPVIGCLIDNAREGMYCVVVGSAKHVADCRSLGWFTASVSVLPCHRGRRCRRLRHPPSSLPPVRTTVDVGRGRLCCSAPSPACCPAAAPVGCTSMVLLVTVLSAPTSLPPAPCRTSCVLPLFCNHFSSQHRDTGGRVGRRLCDAYRHVRVGSSCAAGAAIGADRSVRLDDVAFLSLTVRDVHVLACFGYDQCGQWRERDRWIPSIACPYACFFGPCPCAGPCLVMLGWSLAPI